MAYRILVDENTSPRLVEILRGRGHRAVHVSQALDFGASDGTIADYARANGYAVVTHDDDFLRPTHASGLAILYYADDTIDPDTLAHRIERLSTLVPDQTDLPPVTNLGDWT